jgi:hypothetical protein
MKQSSQTINDQKQENIPAQSHPVSIDATKVSNAVLKRLVEEVRYENQNNISAYNRTHNRHNRGR